MAYEIAWTSEADRDFKNIIDYLTNEWSLTVAQKFVFHTLQRIERIAALPSIARRTTMVNTYLCKLDRKNVVFFFWMIITLSS